MFIQLFFNNPLLGAVWLGAILMSLTVHEFAHALIANRLGDKTAEYEGRLTLNPLSHIDPMGLIMMIALGFGWAKPVPYNPYNLSDPVRGAVMIGLAGPASNFILAGLAGLGLRALSYSGGLDLSNLLVVGLFLLVIVNLFLAFFNLIPVPPLDGSKVMDALLTKPEHANLRIALHTWGPKALMFFVFMAIFNIFDIFSFLAIPAFLSCSALTGESCATILTLIFSL